MANTDTVRQMFDAYLAGDAEAATRLLADDFSFTSPQDDHIDKRAFMERCFPTAARVTSQEIIELVPASNDGVFIMYEYRLTTGERHRNTEFTVVRGGQLAETHVFFGGRYDG
jgi:ketosteroid isomerase-like protein